MLAFEPVFISTTDELYKAASRSIALYGYSPEHNIHDYKYALDEDTENIFVSFSNDMGILAKKEINDPIWWMLAEPLAPQSERALILAAFIKEIFQKKGSEMVHFELMEETYKSLLAVLPAGIHANQPSEILTAPIFELALFDPELRGNAYKGIRSVTRQYYSAHQVEVIDAMTSDSKDLLDLVGRWHNHRTAKDEALDEYYIHIIKENFLGFDTARAILTNGAVIGLNGGWDIPQSGQYYKALGLHDYSDRALGDVLMIEELSWLKNAGYKTADFGAGSKKLTDFKNRFHPNSSYTVYEFTVEASNIVV